MLRTRPTTFAAGALMLVLPFGLSACGSSSSSSTTSSNSSSSAPAAGNSSSGGATSSSNGGDSAGKPDKDAVKSGLTKYYEDKGIKGVKGKDLAGCIVDKGYDKFSAKTLNAMKDGDPTQVDQADSVEFVKVSGECATAAGGSIPTSIPTP